MSGPVRTESPRTRTLSGRQIEGLADQFTDGFGFHQEAVVPEYRVDHLQPVATGQQLGQFLLQPQRVETS